MNPESDEYDRVEGKCIELYGENARFVEFIPINRDEANGLAFTGTIEETDVKCKEGGAVGDVKFSTYDCLESDPPPTCFGGGQRPWELNESWPCCICE